MIYWLLAPAALLLLFWFGTKVHDFFSGRNILGDIGYEFALMRKDIATLDAEASANPNRSDAVVSLTSIPSRLPLIADAIKSLLLQTRAPREIRIYLPKISRREKTHYTIPDFLKGLKSVVLCEVEHDLGPATKYIPALNALNADEKLIVVDDDRIFQPDMVATLEDAANANPEAAFCIGGWIVPDDLTDRDTTIFRSLRDEPPVQVRPVRLKAPKEIDILMGAHAFLVRPRFFDLAHLMDLLSAPEAVFFADDIWISAHCRVPKYALPARRADFQPYRNVLAYDRSSIGWINRKGPPEEWQNSKGLRYFGAAPWRVGGGSGNR